MKELFMVVVVMAATTAFGGCRPATAQEPDANLTITRVDVTAAPDVTVSVAVEGALASKALHKGNFTLLASGEEVPARLTGVPSDPLEVQLVIDTSGSMRGAPIEAAKAAATDLVARLPESVEVGIVGFGDTPYGVIDRTSDDAALTGALATLHASGETAMYDAITLAASRFATDRRVMVLLSDGADTASGATLEAASTALASSGAALYTVALDTPETDGAALQTLAATTGGRVEEAADPAALASVYAAIAARLSALYELTFVAGHTGSTGIVVRASARGGTSAAETRASVPVAAPHSAATGAQAVPAPAPTAEIGGAPGLMGRSWVLWSGLLALFVALGIASFIVVTRAPAPSQLAARRSIRRAGRNGTFQQITEQATGLANRSLDRSGRRGGLERALESAGMNIRAGEFLVLVATGAFAAFAVGLLLGGPLVALILTGLVVGGTRFAVGHAADKRQAKFAEQLEHTLPLMAGGLRAGFGIMQAIDSVAKESQQPTADEFHRVVVETRLGRELDDALEALADRTHNDDFKWVVQAIAIHRQVGGDLAEVLDKVYATIRDRNRMRRQVKALSGEGRLSAIILFTLPIAMFAFISTANSRYIGELTGRTAGVVVLAVAGGLMVLGGLWMRRITRLVF